MTARRLRVLTISDLFPDPARPALGIFVAHQVRHLQAITEQVVVVPVRVFTHQRLWKHALAPRRLWREWRAWQRELRQIPARASHHGSAVHYLRYTSPPRQLVPGAWGFFAYGFVRRALDALHRQHRFDLIHAHCASPAGVIALLARRWMQVPVVLTVHGADLTHIVKQDAVSAAIVRWVLGHADALIVNSAWTAKHAVACGADPGKLSIVHLGAEPEFPVRREHGTRRASGPFQLLTVAYLEQRKGHAVTLAALHRLRALGYAFRYVIVGDGPCRSALLALTAQLGLSDWVAFEGIQPHAEVWRYLDACDVFVLPSWNEAFGVAYIEALSLAKPVIGCEGEGGPDELCALGDCIELVKARDVDSLVVALRRLMDDPERCRQLGDTGRHIVREHFSWRGNAERTLAVYERVLGLP